VNITGSSAKLLVKEIASEFGGRSLAWELFPFSFSEFVATKQDIHTLPKLSYFSTDDVNYSKRFFDEYMQEGSLPESILMDKPQTRVSFLQNIAETVVFRDVIQRYNLSNPKEILRLMQLSLNQMSGLTSYSKLKQRMAGEGFKISKDMVSTAIGYFEDAYMLYTIELFSLNSAVRSTNPKKFYCADHALAMSVAVKIMPDLGKVLENIVFIRLRRQTNLIFYAKTQNGHEIDFVTLPEGISLSEDIPLQLWQVCYELEDTSTLERETRSLWEGMEQFKVDEATIITYNTERTLRENGKTISILPAWKFLLMRN